MQARLARWKSADTGHPLWVGPIVGAVLLGICAGLFGLSAAALEQRFGLWTLFWLRGARSGAQDVVIVALRSDTGDRISLPRLRSDEQPCADLRVDEMPPTHRPMGDVAQRWGRCHFVELMHRLNLVRPRVVAFDVGFRPREELARAEDRVLASAMRESRNVVLAQKVKIRRLHDDSVIEDGPIELERGIAGAAIGAAPTPVPGRPLDRVDVSQTFRDGPFSSPTLPALALQAYCLDAYPALLSVLHRISSDAAADLPRDARGLIDEGQLEVHMLHLRSLLLGAGRSDLAALSERSEHSQNERTRALLRLYTGENMRYLNFYGPPGTIRTIHIADVISVRDGVAATDPLRLRDKAVFVGYSDPHDWEMDEKFSTVYGGRMSGVELLATAFANLLDGSEVRHASPLTRAAVAFTAACLVALMCYVFPVFGALAGTLAAGALYLAAALMLFARTHVAAPVFVPLAVAVPAGYVFALAYKLIDYKRDRGALRDILQKFVPPEVRDLLSENATQFNRIKQTVNAACVMTDIEGFTTLSTKLSSEAMLELLGEYFVAIFMPIADHGGFVVDLKGDSVLAVWTDPQSDSAVRERALRACLDLQAAVARFNREHPEARMPTRLGVNYGVVTLAPVGSLAHRIGYSAVGDTVNAGARIEELGKEVGAYVLVSASMIEGLQGFLVRDLGEFSLRGRSSPTRIFELMGEIAGAPRERLDLCQRYSDARKSYETGDSRRAALELQLLLKDFPEDGPSKHLMRMIERNA